MFLDSTEIFLDSTLVFLYTLVYYSCVITLMKELTLKYVKFHDINQIKLLEFYTATLLQYYLNKVLMAVMS